VFADHSVGLTLREVTSRNFTGDGFYIYVGSHDVTVANSLATNNRRNGITFGGATTGGTVTDSQFVANSAQQFDSEPAFQQTVDDLTILRCLIDPVGASTDYALTVAGSGTATHSKRWVVSDCIIGGGVQIAWADDISVIRTSIHSASVHPAVTVYRSCSRVLVDRCQMSISGAANEVIAIFGTGVNQAPDRVTVSDCVIATGPILPAHGIYAISARSIDVINNDMTGHGHAQAFYGGVVVKSTVIGEEIRSVVVRGNSIRDFGQFGMSLTAAGAAVIRTASITGNSFGDTAGSMTKALNLTVGNDVTESGNSISGGCTTLIASTPSGGQLTAIDGHRWLVP